MFDITDLHDKLSDWKLIIGVLFLSPLAGLMVAAHMPLTHDLWVDGAIFTVLPYAFWIGVHKAVERVRSRRFGVAYAKAFTGMDLLVAVGATLIGPYLVIAFGPTAVASRAEADVVLAVGGALVCGVPLWKLGRALLQSDS